MEPPCRWWGAAPLQGPQNGHSGAPGPPGGQTVWNCPRALRAKPAHKFPGNFVTRKRPPALHTAVREISRGKFSSRISPFPGGPIPGRARGPQNFPGEIFVPDQPHLLVVRLRERPAPRNFTVQNRRRHT